MYYVIKNAPAGQWYADLDKLGNDTVEIGMFDYQDAPVIESFTLGEEKDGRMDVSFRVTQDEDRSYSYKILCRGEKGGDEKELTSGSARTNSDVKTSVDLRSPQAIQPICSSFTFGIRITKRITSIRCIRSLFRTKIPIKLPR